MQILNEIMQTRCFINVSFLCLCCPFFLILWNPPKCPYVQHGSGQNTISFIATAPRKVMFAIVYSTVFYSVPASRPIQFPFISLVPTSKYGFASKFPKYLFILCPGRLLMKMLNQAGINNSAEGNPPDTCVPLNRDTVSFIIRSCYGFLVP